MLGGIDKISTNFDPKRDRPNLDYEKLERYKGGNQQSGRNDQVNLSPFAKYLRELNWTLKDIKQLANDKILLLFYFKNFEFQTEIDFSRFQEIPRMVFNVIGEKVDQFKRVRSRMIIGVNKSRINLNGEYTSTNLTGLNQLFESVLSLELYREVEWFDSIIIEELLEAVYDDLLNEFRNIALGVIKLLDKMDRIDLSKTKFKDDGSAAINIEKIGTVKFDK